MTTFENRVEESSHLSTPGYPLDSLPPVSRDELVLTHLPVVTSIASRLLTKLPSSVDADDMQSVGVLGLIDAAEKFDVSREVRFRTYAEVRIRGAMLDYLRSLSWAPRRLHAKTRELDRVRTAIENAKGCRVVDSDLAEAMGVTMEQHHLLRRELNTVSFQNSDELWDDNADPRGGEMVADPAMCPATELERRELIEIIRQAIERLPERQKVLLWLYYHEELTMKEVGAVLKVSESRASQLHSKALAMLRQEVQTRLRHPAAGVVE